MVVYASRGRSTNRLHFFVRRTANPTTLLLLLALTNRMPTGGRGPFADVVPVVSQAKSLVQLLSGDAEGGRNTQLNFVDVGLGASQLRSLYHLATGDPDKALAVQKRFRENVTPVLETMPIVGHVRGIADVLDGHVERGISTLKRTTATTGAVLGAVMGGRTFAVWGATAGNLIAVGLMYLVEENAADGSGSPSGKLLDHPVTPGPRSAAERETFDTATVVVSCVRAVGVGGGSVRSPEEDGGKRVGGGFSSGPVEIQQIRM